MLGTRLAAPALASLFAWRKGAAEVSGVPPDLSKPKASREGGVRLGESRWQHFPMEVIPFTRRELCPEKGRHVCLGLTNPRKSRDRGPLNWDVPKYVHAPYTHMKCRYFPLNGICSTSLELSLRVRGYDACNQKRCPRCVCATGHISGIGLGEAPIDVWWQP